MRAATEERVVSRFRTHKTGALLAFLAYHREPAHAREVLVEQLWPESAPKTGRNNLRLALSSLRQQLEPPGTPAGSVITANRIAVGLNPLAVTTDVVEFEASLRAATHVIGTPYSGTPHDGMTDRRSFEAQRVPAAGRGSGHARERRSGRARRRFERRAKRCLE